jgi:hypothetical protein
MLHIHPLYIAVQIDLTIGTAVLKALISTLMHNVPGVQTLDDQT